MIVGSTLGSLSTSSQYYSAVFIGTDGVTVVDTKNPGWGAPLLEKIKSVSDKPVVRIINTHTHGDHVSGNVDFPAIFAILRTVGFAGWVIAAAEASVTVTFNATGPERPLTMRILLETCRSIAASQAEFACGDDTFLLSHGIEPSQELPFWLPRDLEDFCRIDNRKAVRHGLDFRPIKETLRDTWDWAQERHDEFRHRLARNREEALIDELRR